MARPPKSGGEKRQDWFTYIRARESLEIRGVPVTVERIAREAGMSRATAFRLHQWVRGIDAALYDYLRSLVRDHPELAYLSLDEVERRGY